MEIEYDFDFFVIGGGSGGLAAAKRANENGKKVGLADFVKPSHQGTKWGIGGTCVNVGCIPKKLMHFASLVGELKHDQQEAGWNVDTNAAHNWNTMLGNVKNHVFSLNWGYKVQLLEKEIEYFNMLASFEDAHTLKLVDANGVEKKITARDILIAVGGRPTVQNFPGCMEHCITSDDLFWSKKPPGKTLIIGAGYIAMECGGFLRGMGYDVSIMVRSVPLRNFDQDMTKRVVSDMESKGIKFIMRPNTDLVEKDPETGKLKVTYSIGDKVDEKIVEEYDTLLIATGRYPDTKALGLDAAGVKYNKWEKIITDDANTTNVEHIFAVGDVIEEAPELTPVAIREGIQLCDRLYAGATKKMNYDNIATTIFTPLEYACVGLTEEKAIALYTSDDIEVYHTSFKPLEWNFLDSRDGNICYCKVICRKTQNMKVQGMHYAGPNAGEVMQGYSVAVNVGITIADINDTIGIHPTCSEEFIGLKITKREQAEVMKSGC